MVMSAIQEDSTENNRLCRSPARDGSPCKARALQDGYCFSHSPALAVKRTAARSKGGSNSAKSVRLRALVPPRLIPVFDKLEAALDEVYGGKLEAKQGTAMAAIARAMVAVLTSGELEERVRDIESKLEGKSGTLRDAARLTDEQLGSIAARGLEGKTQ